MYSPRIVLEKLARFKAKYGWMPVEHSIEEIDRVNAHMKTLYRKDAKGDLIFDDAQLTSSFGAVDSERACDVHDSVLNTMSRATTTSRPRTEFSGSVSAAASECFSMSFRTWKIKVSR